MYVELYMDRFGEHNKVFYNMDWERVPFTTAGDVCDVEVDKPAEFEDMCNVAEKLAKDMAFVRVDLYVHDGKIYFGELTFFPAGGYTPITPFEWDYKLGEQIPL